jgi:hypothetical protein
MGVTATTISSQSELIAELSKPVSELSVVVINAPGREFNADFLKKIYSGIDSM